MAELTNLSISYLKRAGTWAGGSWWNRIAVSSWSGSDSPYPENIKVSSMTMEMFWFLHSENVFQKYNVKHLLYKLI
jgi:hypothetical protein